MVTRTIQLPRQAKAQFRVITGSVKVFGSNYQKAYFRDGLANCPTKQLPTRLQISVSVGPAKSDLRQQGID